MKIKTELKSTKIRVGISMGDPNGIGIETLLKAFEDKRLFDFFTPIFFGSTDIIEFQKKTFNLETEFVKYSKGRLVENKVNIKNIFSNQSFKIEFGKKTTQAGEYAIKSLVEATNALKSGEIHTLVTLPINKENTLSESFPYTGHTEFLEKELQGDSLMFMVSDTIKIGLMTAHIPIEKVSKNITDSLLENKIVQINDSLIRDFNIIKPKIAVLGLNPHSGDNGSIGNEEIKIISPCIRKIFKEKGIVVMGPFSADGFFGSEHFNKFDAVLAMYHDQGLVPFKTIVFGKGVNFTAGLNKIRTSPDHGTAFDIAGKNIADKSSLIEALFTSRDIFINRKRLENIEKEKLYK